jgi:hypothetical protein
MHHATDVLGSVVLAIGTLSCAIVVARVTAAASLSRPKRSETADAPSVATHEVTV